MDDDFLYNELKTISSNQSKIESLVTGLKSDMEKICEWKDSTLPTLQICKDYMEKRADLPDRITDLENKVEIEENLNKEARKDVKFLMTWFFKIAGGIGFLIIINTILVLIKNLSDLKGVL